MIKIFTFTIALTILFFTGIAQNTQQADEYFKPSENKLTTDFLDAKPAFKKTLDYSFEVGAAFTSFGKTGSLYSSYIAPQVNYHVSPRLTIHSGVMLERNSLMGSGFPTENGYKINNGNFNNVYLFTEAEYKFNERLKISGMILYETNKLNNNNSLYNSSGNNLSYIIRGDYKITDHLHVGFELRKSDTPGYMNNPYSRNCNYGFSNMLPFPRNSFSTYEGW
jgi:hypothetical protein